MREKEFLPQVKERLGIEELNDMQRRMMSTTGEARDVILLSPTGSGKTLAFILPVLKLLRPGSGRVQAIVVAPSRELVLQIAGVFQKIGAGMKTTPLYGGHKFEDEENSLKAGTDIVVATPGRLLDHINRRTIDVLPDRILVLDEFDKSLELGFETEMKKIVGRLKNVSHIILTSATRAASLPDFLKLTDPLVLDYLGDTADVRRRLRVHRVDSGSKDKLAALGALLENLWSDTGWGERVIVFVNHRESAERVAAYLQEHGLPAVLYHGALDQRDRETAVARFNNGSRPVLVATDLAARGLDIKEVKAVVHYHQPLTPEAYVHRNGRTARVDADGDIFILAGPEENIREYVDIDDEYWLDTEKHAERVPLPETLCFGAGKKEKISKGDILGFLVKECGLEPTQIGAIDVNDHYALAAVTAPDYASLLAKAKGAPVKGKRRMVSLL